jgi:hypothetical protein
MTTPTNPTTQGANVHSELEALVFLSGGRYETEAADRHRIVLPQREAHLNFWYPKKSQAFSQAYAWLRLKAMQGEI